MMKIRTTYLSLQEIGQRTNQEDSIYPALGQIVKDNDLFILCDGMGGHDCGEVASQTVCQAMSAFILEHPDTDFETALNAAYDALDAKDNDAEKKMGTTLTFVKFDEGQCLVAHIGDSRVYQIRPSEKKIVYVTRDHSLVNDLVACGELSPEEAKHSSQKNIITRAMQPHQERRAKADVAILTDIKAGDYFYMCSDGMLEISEDEDIVNVLSLNKTDEQKLSILKNVTKDNKDNHSAHLIRVVSIDDVPSHGCKPAKKRVFLSKRTLWMILAVAVAIVLFMAGRKSVFRFHHKKNDIVDPTEQKASDTRPKEEQNTQQQPMGAIPPSQNDNSSFNQCI